MVKEKHLLTVWVCIVEVVLGGVGSNGREFVFSSDLNQEVIHSSKGTK